jgi:hypothetical protein
MVAPFADVARYRSPLTAAGLFDFGYDARIRRQLIRRPLDQRAPDGPLHKGASPLYI